MKTLTFTTLDRYEILYEGLIAPSEFSFKGNQIRLINKVMDKMEAIGKLKDGDDGKLGIYTLNFPHQLLSTEYPSIELEDQEFSLLLDKFNSISWTTAGARKVANVYDWLNSMK